MSDDEWNYVDQGDTEWDDAHQKFVTLLRPVPRSSGDEEDEYASLGPVGKAAAKKIDADDTGDDSPLERVQLYRTRMVYTAWNRNLGSFIGPLHSTARIKRIGTGKRSKPLLGIQLSVALSKGDSKVHRQGYETREIAQDNLALLGRFDFYVLLRLLGESYRQHGACVLEFPSIYALLKCLRVPSDSQGKISSYYYDGIQLTLDRLMDIRLEYKNFYIPGKDGKGGRHIRSAKFVPVSSYTFEARKGLPVKIGLDQQFLEINQEFFAKISSEVIRRLKSDFEVNLYVFLCCWRYKIQAGEVLKAGKLRDFCERMGMHHTSSRGPAYYSDKIEVALKKIQNTEIETHKEFDEYQTSHVNFRNKNGKIEFFFQG